MRSTRRQFLEIFGGGTLAAGFGFGLGRTRRAAAQSAGAPLAVAELADGLSLVTGAGGNVVVAAAGGNLLLVDSGAAEHVAALERLLGERFGGSRVATLFNTHWHLDHTGGNDALAPGAMVVAHENTRLWMSTKFYVEWEDLRYDRRAPEALPNETFYSSDPQPLELSLGGERVVYGHLREAHTDGDVYVSFPERNVIAAGGTVTARRYPVLDYSTGGWIGGLMDATQALIDMCDERTLVVPDAGPPQRRADLAAQLEMLTKIRERIEELALVGKGIDEIVAAGLTQDFDARFSGDPALFVANAYEGMWWNRMRGIVA